MKKVLLIIFIFSVVGCAQTMTISEEKLGDNRAILTLDASDLQGYVSIPLINSKVVNTYLSEFPECVDGKPKIKKSDSLGNATLTPKKYIQTVEVPSGVKLLVSTNSDENTGGNVYTCWNSMHFIPEKNKEYVLKIKPHKSFSSKKCSSEIFEKTDGKLMPVESAVYPKVEYKGFWRGDQFNHCETSS